MVQNGSLELFFFFLKKESQIKSQIQYILRISVNFKLNVLLVKNSLII